MRHMILALAVLHVLLVGCGGAGQGWIDLPEPTGISMNGTWSLPTSYGITWTCSYPSGLGRTVEYSWYTYAMETTQVGQAFSGHLRLTFFPATVSPYPGEVVYEINGSVGSWEGGEVTRGSAEGWYPLEVAATRVSGNSQFYPATMDVSGQLYGSGNLHIYMSGASDCTTPSQTGSRLSGSISGYPDQ